MSKVLKWVVNIILLTAIVVAGALLIPSLTGVTTVIVDSLELETNLPVGSVTYAVDKGIQELKANDNILIEKSSSAYIYRVDAVDTEAGEITIRDVKSVDSNEKTEAISSSVSKVVIVIPYIGYVVMAMKSTEGLIIIGLAVVFVIILFILAELWKTDADVHDEEEDDDEAAEAEEPPAQIDMSSHIMETVSSAIASEISSAVEENEAAQLEERAALDELVVNEVLPAAADEEPEQPDEQLTKEQQYAKEVQEAEALRASLKEPQKSAAADTREPAPPEESSIVNEQQEAVETGEEQEVQQEEHELAMPIYTAAELIQKAKEAGDDPEVRYDEESGITILDYSDIL